jgi:hypothetical protein
MNVRPVDWFYVQNGSQIGPVPVEQIDDLVRSGRITAQTLVWREGLANWQPFGLISATPSSLPLPPAPPPPPAPPGGVPPVIAGGLTPCIECGNSFAQSEMICYGDAWICARCKPVFFQRIREGAPLASGGANVWRSRASLVTLSGTALPVRCAKCGGPVTGRHIPRTLYWHQPWVYVLIIVSLPVYIIVSLIVRKKAKLAIPVCEEHRRKRNVAILVSWLLVVLALAGFTAAIAQDSGLWAMVGLGLVVASIVLGLWKGTLVSAKKIDGDYVWVNGFSKEYLESLPEFPDYR